ncbi:MAG: MipA/OmpV family protein [Halofilum sp. (in: g-proteobacteria)]
MYRLIPLVLALSIASAAAPAAEKPLWELGVGVAPVSFPAYRGADEQRGFTFPIPYIVYRGERLRVDRGGARGMLWDSESVEVDLSLDGAIPVDSTDEGPRAGMENLDPILELGPSLKVRLAETESGRLEFRLPVRAAIAIDDGSTHQEGWKVHPMLNYNAPDLVDGWDVGFNIGPKFASRDFHAYYYDVRAADVTPARPAYRADAGYSGLSMLVSASRRFDRFWVGSFLRYDNVEGAAFDDSPLVETDHAISAGVAISWILWQSEETVRVDPRAAPATGR